MKYLLSGGRGTTKIEEYLIDLFKIYLKIYPGDIPGAPEYGFDFNLQGIYQDELPAELESRVARLVQKVNSRFAGEKVKLEVESLEIISPTKARLQISAGALEDDIEVNIY